MTRIFFATDVHGSEICWKKFINAGKFYEATILILGGDMTGKAIIPIIAQGDDKYKVTLLDQETILDGKAELDKMAATIQDRGYYPYVTDPDEVAEISATPGRSDAIFLDKVLSTIDRWMEYADARLEGSGMTLLRLPGQRRHVRDRQGHRRLQARAHRRGHGHPARRPPRDAEQRLVQPHALEDAPRGAGRGAAAAHRRRCCH